VYNIYSDTLVLHITVTVTRGDDNLSSTKHVIEVPVYLALTKDDIENLIQRKLFFEGSSKLPDWSGHSWVTYREERNYKDAEGFYIDTSSA